LAQSHLVEDLLMTVGLALAGYPPIFCAHVSVTSRLPKQAEVVRRQRLRWEHGHLTTILTAVPRLLMAALRQRRFALAVLALDLCIPPLALFTLLCIGTATVTLLSGFWTGAWGPAVLVTVAGLLMCVAVGSAWAGCGRAVVPFATLLAVPAYVVWKVPIYLSFLYRRQTTWSLEDREEVAP
jgi:cellulose synthase/poly-beta-1,6-N-acetylglucosamine synthase-like glycosyltransferase